MTRFRLFILSNKNIFSDKIVESMTINFPKSFKTAVWLTIF